MLKLSNIITQMHEEDYAALCEKFRSTKADKFLTLLVHYRENKESEDEIQKTLQVNSSAFYTLKSRLYTKVQQFFTVDSTGSKIDLLKDVASIPNLLFNTQRETAIAILKKMEKALIEFDMPYELASVYNALKKLHIHTDKYYEYTQFYNKHLAYTIALDKSEDILTNFSKALGEYAVSRDTSKLPILELMKKELANHSRLYKSNHLQVYQNFADIYTALFLPLEEAVKNDLPVEDILNNTVQILQQYDKDSTYRFLNIVLDYLYFEYYFHIGQVKKCQEYYRSVNEMMQSFMLCNFCCFPAAFLIRKIEFNLIQGTEKNLVEENEIFLSHYTPDKQDIPSYIYFNKYLAACSFHAGMYPQAITLLNNLLNEISFKHYPHAEVEIKLFLCLLYTLTNKLELANTIYSSVSRKAREIQQKGQYENTAEFIKILKIQLSADPAKNEHKLTSAINRFKLMNQGSGKMLEFIRMDDAFTKKLLKSVK